MTRTKRLFVAINTSELFGPTFKPILRKLKIGADQKDLIIKWTPPENYHVTLNFIGDRPEQEVALFVQALEEVAAIMPSFNLKMEDVSAFPSEVSGRVIYVGVQAKKILHLLKSTINEKFKEKGLIPISMEDEDFVPHLTIARLRNPQHVKDFLSPVKRKSFGKIEVKEIVLYESHLNGQYPAYIPLKRFQLQVPTEEIEVSNFADPRG